MDLKQQALIELSIRELEERHTLQRNSLYEFFKFYWKEEKGEELDENRHIQQICDKLQAVFEGKIKRLIINIPPRSLKTEISKAFAVWCLGKKENIKLMSISYSADLTQKTSGEARNIYVSKAFRLCFPRAVGLREDQNTKQHWENEAGGQYYAAGSTGTITGVGADCVTGDTVIITNQGRIQIKDVKKYGKLSTYSYNHSTNTIELKTIVAFRKIEKKNVYEITTSKGDKIRATGDHRIFILGKGYTKTQDIQIGDTVKKVMSLQEMQQGEMREMRNVSGMLFGDEKSNITVEMGFLQYRSGKENKRYEKIITKLMQGCVLFKDLFNEFPQSISKVKMQELGMIQKKNKYILQGGMQEGNITKKESKQDDGLSGMLKENVSVISKNKVLFYAMQKRQSLKDYASGMKLKLQTLICFGQLSKRVLSNEKTSIRERLMNMYNMLNNGLISNSSQGQKSKKQQYKQFSNCLLTPSRYTPSFDTDTISSVELVEGEFDVYDIQVEGNNNFFANNILIHNCIMIDDPIKPSEAQSDVVRNSVNSNYHNTIKSRLNNKQEGAIVIIMQRLHDDDLCGHLMDLEDKGGEQWDKLIIPAIAEEDEEHRKQGESFFEKRFPIAILNEYKRENSIMFACQYQQNPVDKETQEFHEEWFRYHGIGGQDTPTNLRVFTTCDPAFKTGQENDNSCIMTGGFIGDRMYILEYSAGKWNADILLDKIIYHIQKWSPEKVGIEAFQAQSMIVTFLKNELAKRGKYTTIEEIKQTGDKLSKIRRLVPLYRNGLIHHKYGMDELELELKRFPRGKHDDIIDAEQMLYDLYQIQPNSTTRLPEFKMEWDNYGRPIYNFSSDSMFDV